MEKSTRTRIATILILLLVLATGSVLGVAVDRRLVAGKAGSETAEAEVGKEGEREEGEEARRENRRRTIVEQVGLSPEQKVQVDSIVAHYRHRMRELERELENELRQAYLPRYRELVQGTREEIKGLLTPVQRIQYDSLLVEWDRRMEERRNRGSDAEPRG